MHWGSEPQEMKQERRKTEKESDERKSVPAACHVHRRIICDDGGDRPVGKIAAGGVAHQLHPPYAMTCIWGIEMGKATVGIVFGYFTTFCNWCVSFLPEPDGIVLRVILLLLSAVCIGSFGSVGVGTVIAAVLVGTVLGFFTKWLGARRDCWLFGKETVRE